MKTTICSFSVILIRKRKYIVFATLAEMDDKQAELVKKCFIKIPEIAKALELDSGYRIIINQGKDAGQTVFHLHIHILGGQEMGEKML